MNNGGIKVADEFFDHFADRIVPISESGCWIWTGSSTNAGYGEVKVSGRRTLAHRAAAIAGGILTDPQNMVRHRCDVPCCVNPQHLLEGTQVDNMHDMKARGRQSRGEHRPFAKLNAQSVREIRNLLAEGLSSSVIAARFGVSQSRISKINTGKIWGHVQ